MIGPEVAECRPEEEGKNEEKHRWNFEVLMVIELVANLSAEREEVSRENRRTNRFGDTYVELEDQDVVDPTMMPSCEIEEECESEEYWKITRSEQLKQSSPIGNLCSRPRLPT
jgi:hypothetical protein